MKYVANPVVVDAFTITKVIEASSDHPMILELEGGVLASPNAGMLARMTPVAGDYWVIQSDGYVYLNPKEVFERKYSPQILAGASGTSEPAPEISAPAEAAEDHSETTSEATVDAPTQPDSEKPTEPPKVEVYSDQQGLIRCTSCGTWVNHMNVCPGCGAQLSLQSR